MKKMLKRLVLLIAIGALAYYLWGQRAEIAKLSNNNLKIQGTWYLVELDRRGITPYYFAERVITVNDSEWGSFELRKNTELEVMVGNELTLYHLSFPDDETMLWEVLIDGKLTPAMKWSE